jgi:tRNA threonylcarbamoyladenosine biosynthesis protein TsaE
MLPPAADSTRSVTTSLAQTHALGKRLGRLAQPGALILLSGPMGSGKTALTQGIAQGLAITETVNSPTFTLLKEHHSGRLPLYHFDLYRVGDPAEIWSLGVGEYFAGSGVCVVEWAELAPDAWTDGWLWLHLAVQGDAVRAIRGVARGALAQHLLLAFTEKGRVASPPNPSPL